jgi:L-seryl-tRNA(Ser) seleniumtransferase
MRPDKTILAALGATLGLYRAGLATREIPVWRAIAASADELVARAEALAAGVGDRRVRAAAMRATVGGGSLPGQTLPSAGLVVTAPGRSADLVLAALRSGDPRVIGRVEDQAVLLDLRTVPPDGDADLAAALRRALAGMPGGPGAGRAARRERGSRG